MMTSRDVGPGEVGKWGKGQKTNEREKVKVKIERVKGVTSPRGALSMSKEGRWWGHVKPWVVGVVWAWGFGCSSTTYCLVTGTRFLDGRVLLAFMERALYLNDVLKW